MAALNELKTLRYLIVSTIISGERFSSEIVEIDEAVGGRIYERAKDFCKRDAARKHRIWTICEEARYDKGLGKVDASVGETKVGGQDRARVGRRRK